MAAGMRERDQIDGRAVQRLAGPVAQPAVEHTLAAGADLSDYDNETETAIAYLSRAGADGTPAGTRITYNDERSVRAIARWARQKTAGCARAGTRWSASSLVARLRPTS